MPIIGADTLPTLLAAIDVLQQEQDNPEIQTECTLAKRFIRENDAAIGNVDDVYLGARSQISDYRSSGNSRAGLFIFGLKYNIATVSGALYCWLSESPLVTRLAVTALAYAGGLAQALILAVGIDTNRQLKNAESTLSVLDRLDYFPEEYLLKSLTNL